MTEIIVWAAHEVTEESLMLFSENGRLKNAGEFYSTRGEGWEIPKKFKITIEEVVE